MYLCIYGQHYNIIYDVPYTFFSWVSYHYYFMYPTCFKLEDCCTIRSTEFIKIVYTVFTKPDILNRISHTQERYVYVLKKYCTSAFNSPDVFFKTHCVVLCWFTAIKTHIFNIQPSAYIDCIVYTLWLFVNCNFLHYITPVALIIIIIITTVV